MNKAQLSGRNKINHKINIHPLFFGGTGCRLKVELGGGTQSGLKSSGFNEGRKTNLSTLFHIRAIIKGKRVFCSFAPNISLVQQCTYFALRIAIAMNNTTYYSSEQGVL